MAALAASSDLPTLAHVASQLLPIPPSIKVTPRAVYVGDPKQLVDLLVSKVATAILEITRTKGNQPLYKLKLRCKTLFTGNIEVFFLLDYPNQRLLESANYKGKKLRFLRPSYALRALNCLTCFFVQAKLRWCAGCPVTERWRRRTRSVPCSTLPI